MPSTDASPTQLAAWVQGHWAIESKLHWVRDVVFDEDRSTVRTGSAPRVMAALRSTAISIPRMSGSPSIAAASRHHARDSHRPAELLRPAETRLCRNSACRSDEFLQPAPGEAYGATALRGELVVHGRGDLHELLGSEDRAQLLDIAEGDEGDAVLVRDADGGDVRHF